MENYNVQQNEDLQVRVDVVTDDPHEKQPSSERITPQTGSFSEACVGIQESGVGSQESGVGSQEHRKESASSPNLLDMDSHMRANSFNQLELSTGNLGYVPTGEQFMSSNR